VPGLAPRRNGGRARAEQESSSPSSTACAQGNAVFPGKLLPFPLKIKRYKTKAQKCKMSGGLHIFRVSLYVLNLILWSPPWRLLTKQQDPAEGYVSKTQTTSPGLLLFAPKTELAAFPPPWIFQWPAEDLQRYWRNSKSWAPVDPQVKSVSLPEFGPKVMIHIKCPCKERVTGLEAHT